MSIHCISADDRRFRSDVEQCRITPDAFGHRAHLRLAYIYLADNDCDSACALMRDALLQFLAHHGIDPSRYHETVTRAWILAVRHFMERSPSAASADAFIDSNATLLDSRIMMTHYSAQLLFSPEARGQFVEPDLEPISPPIPPDDARFPEESVRPGGSEADRRPPSTE